MMAGLGEACEGAKGGWKGNGQKKLGTKDRKDWRKVLR